MLLIGFVKRSNFAGGKRTAYVRKALAGGDLSEVVTLEIDGVSIVVANSLSPAYIAARPDTLQWLVNRLHMDLTMAVESIDTVGSDVCAGADIDTMPVVCAESDDDEYGQEADHFVAEIEKLKQNKDPDVQSYIPL
jgi:hypothetical protein